MRRGVILLLLIFWYGTTSALYFMRAGDSINELLLYIAALFAGLLLWWPLVRKQPNEP